MAKMKNIKGLKALDKYKDYDWWGNAGEEPEDDDDLVAYYGSSDGGDVFLLPKDLRELYDNKNSEAMAKLIKMINLPEDTRIGPWGLVNDEGVYYDDFDWDDELDENTLKELANIRNKYKDNGGIYDSATNSWENPFDVSSTSPERAAKLLLSKYEATRKNREDIDELADDIRVYRSLYDRKPEDFQGQGLENLYEPIIFDNVSNDDFLAQMVPWLYDLQNSKFTDMPPEAVEDIKRALHSDKGLPEPDFFEPHFKEHYLIGEDNAYEKEYNEDPAVRAIQAYKKSKASKSQDSSKPESKEKKSDKDTVSDMTQKNIIAGLQSFNI